MPFNRNFFDNLHQLLKKYFAIYPCGFITLTLTAYGQEYQVVRILESDERLLTFIFYSNKKSKGFSQKLHEKTGESRAWPAVTVPYESISAVEFNPGQAAGSKQFGFYEGLNSGK